MAIKIIQAKDGGVLAQEVTAVEAVRRADTGYASQGEPAGFPDGYST